MLTCFTAFLMILTLLITTETIVLAEEMKEQMEEAVTQYQEEKRKQDVRTEQQEYIEEHQAVPTEAAEEKEPASPSDRTEEIVISQPELESDAPDVHEQLYGQPIEVYEYGKVYRTDTNTYKFIGTSDPCTYEDENGERKEIDNTLVLEPTVGLRTLFADRDAATYYTNQEGGNDVKLPAQMQEGRGLTITNQGGKTLELFPYDGIYENAAVLENAILYNEVFEHVDVQYTVKGNRIKEDIILKEPGEKNSFSYSFSNAAYDARLKNNVVVITDKHAAEAKQEVLYYLTAPGMSDRAGEVSEAVTLELREEGERYILTVTADAAWLHAAERVYPVKIDPTVNIPSGSMDVVTTSSIHGTYSSAAYGYVGYTDNRVTGVSGANIGKTRMFYKINYNFASIIPEEAVVTSATLNAYAYSAYPASTDFTSYRLTQSWNPASINWTNSVNLGREISGEHASQPGGKGWKRFDIRQSVNDWKTGLAANHGLMIMAANELNPGNAFYTPYSSTSIQPSFRPEYYPYIEVNWEYPDPVAPDYPLNDTILTLRTLIACDRSGKLQFQGVFADGIATPESTVAYGLDESSKGYIGTASAGHTKKYPDSESFESAFSANTTRYRDKLSNWQTALPFTNPDFDQLYKIEAAAVKGGNTGTVTASDQFLIYQVKQFDTLPKIAAYYGIPLSQILYDNRVQDMLVVENNTLFIRNPQKNSDKPYNPPALTDSMKAQIDAQLMGRGLHCEFGFEPVNLNTGNFYFSSTDVTIPDYNSEFAIERTYNSKGAAYISNFGRGWQFSYGQALSKAEDGTILYTREDGSVLRFTDSGNQTYECPEGYDLELTAVQIRTNTYDFGNGDETYPVYEYEIKDTEQNIRRFDCFGMLVSMNDQTGNKTTLAYDSNLKLKSVTSAADSVNLL